ncbi:MAG: glycosyltransferase family 2 protein [Clostridiales bacterium]|nr:glycosyltransferase family 2 protein [Clostridiales bacterium]
MANPFISIIIPVYNIEDYLPACLNSVLACDLSDAEVLIADDGSADGSGEICDRYAAGHKTLRALHKPNGGPSDARNYGLGQAKGEWIIFIDGDDTVLPERFDEFAHQLRTLSGSVDVVLNDYITFDINTGKTYTSRQIDNAVRSLPQVLSKRGHIWNIVRYAYRGEFLERAGLRFKAGYLAEDFEFTVRLLEVPDLQAEFVHIPYYVYALNRGGSTMTANPFRLLECVTQVVRTHYPILRERKDSTSRLLQRKLLREYLYMLPRVYQFKGKARSGAIALFGGKGSPLRVGATLIATFGLLARKAWNIYKKVR